MKGKRGSDQYDVPVPAALSIAAVVVITVLAKGSDLSAKSFLTGLEVLFERHGLFLTAGFLAIAVNFAWISGAMKRSISMTKQGSRLKRLIGKKPRPGKGFWWKVFTAAFVGGAVFGGSYLLPISGVKSLYLRREWRDLWEVLSLLASLNLAVTATLLTKAILTVDLRKLVRDKASRTLPPFPAGANTVTLGAIHEE